MDGELYWLIIAGLIFFGLCFGSFLNAMVWRLHAGRDFVRERSECDHCHHQLAWYDLVPVLSWVSLGGRCRYCRKPISWQHPLVEMLTALAFVGSFLFWPYGWSDVAVVLFAGWLISLVILIALAVYDMKWMLLPDKLTFPLMGLSFVMGLILTIGVMQMTLSDAFLFMGYGVLSIGGLYYVLYILTKRRGVGFGDVKLGVAMGLMGGWKVGLITVMLANVIGLLAVLPGMISGKVKFKSRIPFGPFLIIGFIVAYVAAEPLINWYLSLILLG